MLATLRISLALSVLALAHAQCATPGRFEITIKTSFVPARDPLIPSEDDVAQIPIILSMTHASSFELFRVSKRMNDSVAEVSSRGTSSDIRRWIKDSAAEMDLSRRLADYEILESRDNDTIPVEGEVKVRLKTNKHATRLSIMVHLSPSPQWFAGVDALDLCDVTTQNETLKNLNSGLDKAHSFESDPDPYPQGSTVPVSLIDFLEDIDLVKISIVRLPPTKATWWKPTLGVSVTVVVIGIGLLGWFILKKYPVLKRSDSTSQASKLASPDRVEW